MPLPKRLVVTVHGINTAGKWQEDLQHWLGDHFEFRSIKYPHYRWFGATKLLFEPWALLAGAIFFGLLWFFNRRLSAGETAAYWLGVLLLALVGALLRRTSALNRVASQMGKIAVRPGDKYLVAHSLGTYLSGMTMRKYASVRFHSAVLTGCVLARDFDWQDVQRNGPLLKRVLNEVAGSDVVPRLAFFLAGFVPRMGHAGRYGFAEVPDRVHTIPPATRDCPRCSTERQALVHNLVSPEMRHSDHFITESYAFSYWLPFFWGLSAGDFQSFLKLCEECDEAERGGFFETLAGKERLLHTTEWRWTGPNPRTLPQYIEAHIRAQLAFKGLQPPDDPTIRQWTAVAVRNVWRTIAAARYRREPAGLLYPPSAVTRVVNTLVQNWLGGGVAVRRIRG